MKATRLVEAKLKPSMGNGMLFDSKPQTEPEDSKESTIEFAQTQTFDRIRVWQGLSEDRAKSFSISIDGAPGQ
ncbi:MAG: hypothetical protein V4760_19610, partial [Bdellovibrionota bacterium]